MVTGPSMFYHYLELHHSQTTNIADDYQLKFYHYLELHHSQTADEHIEEFLPFYHYLELHHSQTGVVVLVTII